MLTHAHARIHVCTHTSINIVLGAGGESPRPGKIYNTLNNFESSSGEPWKILQAGPGPPE